jgi:polar amino acid transport system substrate-binding protein
MNRRALLAAGAAGLLTAVAAFTVPAFAADSVIAQIKAAKTIKVGVGTFVPWSFPNKDGKLIGFEVDVANRLADDLGVKLELVPTAWDAIIPSLVAGKYDVIIGGLTITDERAKSVDFTIPYEHSLTYAVVNKKLAPDLSTLAQLNAPTVTFANRRGASASSAKYFPNSQSLSFDDENTQEQEFLNGNVTALTVSTPTQALLAEDHPDIVRIIEPPVTQTNEAFALRKDDPDSIAAFNQWIKTHTDDGWLQQRFDYWFKGRLWKDQVASK